LVTQKHPTKTTSAAKKHFAFLNPKPNTKHKTTLTMKRGLESEPSLPLKQRSSSLFPISAAQNEDETLSNDISSSNSSLKQVRSALISPTATPPPGITDAEDDGISSEEGLFIEETSLERLHLQSSETVLPSTEVQTQNAPPGDHRTGVMFEHGSRHFDRHNRLHKERPIRVQSIQEALEKNQIISRCMLVEPLESAANFLNDDDYLRVHLPGYMQRYVPIADRETDKNHPSQAPQYF
jgi:hypothetical protein